MFQKDNDSTLQLRILGGTICVVDGSGNIKLTVIGDNNTLVSFST